MFFFLNLSNHLFQSKKKWWLANIVRKVIEKYWVFISLIDMNIFYSLLGPHHVHVWVGDSTVCVLLKIWYSL